MGEPLVTPIAIVVSTQYVVESVRFNFVGATPSVEVLVIHQDAAGVEVKRQVVVATLTDLNLDGLKSRIVTFLKGRGVIN